MDPYTERRTRAALDALADQLDATADELGNRTDYHNTEASYTVRALIAHLRDTPAGALDTPQAIAAELAEAYAAALLATDQSATSRAARRAISGAIRSAAYAPSAAR